MNLFQRWRDSLRHRPILDSLLTEAPAEDAPLRERVAWLGRLVNWVRVEGLAAGESSLSETGRVQTMRLKYVLQVLSRNGVQKAKVVRCLRSILGDTRSLELFMHVGVPNQQGFIGELIERVTVWLLPQPPDDQNLEFLFSNTFRYESDAEWIDQMDPEVFRGWLELFRAAPGVVLAADELAPGSGGPANGKLLREVADALFILSHSVRAVGLSRVVRRRVAEQDFRALPFFELTEQAERLIAARTAAERAVAEAAHSATVDRCRMTLEEVYGHYRDHGVTIELVYQTERLKALLERCRTLGHLLAAQDQEGQDAAVWQPFLGYLVRENIRARKVRKLLTDNLVLVCRKIVETNAETGAHYITRDRVAYVAVLKKAWGGGAVTGLTTFVKFLLSHLSAPPFFSGIFAFANYSVSFLALQALGFTLATKQPAMTASALSDKIGVAGDSVEPLIEEIVHLVRSQLAAVVGNLTMVVPVVMLIDWIYAWSGAHLTDAAHARHTMESFSLLGPTPFYAAGTGVLLWLSSLSAGWFGNWFNFRGLPEAVEHHPRLRYVAGPALAHRLGVFLKANIAGIAASLSLAFLLGMTPQFASFFGFPFDVRHVTLSTGALTASVMALGTATLSERGFWLAVGGILSMGLLNLAVSFTLALIVAIWAKGVSAPKRGVIYRAIWSRFSHHPWTFLLPGPVATETPNA